MTVKVTWPFWTWILTGGADPLIVKLESFEVWEIVMLSDDTVFLLQSRISTVKVTVEPVFAVTGDAG